MSLNPGDGDAVLSSILAHYRFPGRTFVGSPARVEALKKALEAKGRADRP